MEKNQKYQLNITGMDCADCAVNLEKNITKLSGVKFAQIDFINGKLNVEFDGTINNFKDIETIIKQAGYSIKKSDSLQQSTLIVKGMDCLDESRPIEHRLKKINGVYDIKFNLIANKLIVRHSIPLKEIKQALKELGFEAELSNLKKDQVSLSFWVKHKMLILTLVSGIFAIIGTIYHYIDVSDQLTIPIFVVAIISGGFHIAKKGFAEAKSLRLGMNFLMSFAVIGATIIGQWSEAAMVIFLFALAQLLESYSIDRARRSIQSLMELAPNVATLKTESGTKSLPVEEVRVGDIMIIKPGERIPLDGVVISGSSSVNQAPITGESVSIKKSTNDDLYAGTINQTGMLEVQVTKKSSDSTLARIIHLVEEAQAQKAPSQSFVEKFAKYYTPTMVAFAVLLAILPSLLLNTDFMDWFYRALVLLVISCPCALVISTPVTIVSGLANAARNGILIKGGAFLENFSHLNVLAFDKTGTLTFGKPQVQQIIPLNHHCEEDLLTIAASIESRSEHPLAQAIVDYASSKNISLKQIDHFSLMTGKGVSASIDGITYYIGNHRLFEENNWCEQEIHQYLEKIEQRHYTVVIVGNMREIMGIIAIADGLRENVDQAIRQLHDVGIQKTVMLTGDNHQTAAAIASKIGIDDFKAELLPQDKVIAIKQLLGQYKEVAMVGDGINDAPALATATMGISMGYSATDTALETADIALMKDDLSKLAYLKKLSFKTVRIIKQNIFFSLFLKGIFMVLALIGWATLWMAVFADMGASLIVVMNGLRALKNNI